jgi:Flp pilus assembly protein TadG
MAEFAIVLPVLVLLLFGILDMGKAVYAYSYVSYSAREATRWAAVRGQTSKTPASSSDVQAFIVGETQGLDTKQLTVTTSWSPDNKPGSVVTVQVQYSLPLSVPLLPTTTLALTSASKMVIQQ